MVSAKLLNREVELLQKYDYSKLMGRIKEYFGSQAAFAARMKLSERSISLKLNGLRGWKQDEIVECCSLLEISYENIPKYFFTLKVQN